MTLDKDTITFCRLVAFAESEIQKVLEANPEGYAADVLKRFQTIYPDAVLMTGDIDKIDSKAWKELLSKNYVQHTIDNTWIFYRSSYPSISVEIGTDGSISIDDATSERIFNW